MRKMLTVLLMVFMCSTLAYSGGFNLYEHGTKAVGMASAVVANPQDASTIFYNPGALAFIEGTNFYGGAAIIRPSNKFVGTAPMFDNTVHETVSHTHLAAHIYFSHQLSEKLVVGLGMSNPYGLAIEWKEGFPGNGIAKFTDLKSFYIMPVISYKITDNLSVGGGVDVVYSTVTLRRDVALIEGGTPVAELELKGNNGLAYGFSAGMLFKTNFANFGLSYRHKVENKFDNGEAKFKYYDTYANNLVPIALMNQSADASINFPSTFVAGLNVKLMKNLRAEFDYIRFGWSTFDKIPLNFDQLGEQVIPENYKNSNQFRFGVDYELSPAISLTAGYIYDESPQPTETVSPQLPDNDRNDYSFGIRYKKNNMIFDVSYLLVDFGTRSTVENGVGQNHYGFDGEYSGLAHLFLVSWGINLGK